ncbi:MAG: sulfatase-like hydrolase/transferase [Chloroflexia bacterium]|nr:sulfatase-like hydrolase/transferase [Chloroflexia bacterium]
MTGTKQGPLPLKTALWAGLHWGLLVGFVDNAATMLERNVLETTQYAYIPSRLLAILYTTTFYALFFSLLAAVMGLIATLLLRVTGRTGKLPALIGIYVGLLSGTTIAAFWNQRYQVIGSGLRIPQFIWLVGAVLVGTLLGRIGYHLAGHWQRQREQGNLLLQGGAALMLVSVTILLCLGLYRAWFAGSAWLHPDPPYEPATAERPNIVLITIDTLRADHLGAYGYDPEISPHLDALAQGGVRFEQAIAQSSWTVPSVASMITSMYPSELGVQLHRGVSTQLQLDPLRVTLAEVLREQGYHTGACLTNGLLPGNGFEQGIHEFAGTRVPGSFDEEVLKERPLFKSMFQVLPPAGHFFSWGYQRLFNHRFDSDNDGPAINHFAQRFLQKHREGRFFLWLYYMEPHTPYDPSQIFPPPPAGTEADPNEDLVRQIDFWKVVDAGPKELSPEGRELLHALYAGEIHDVDTHVGQVVAMIEELGLSDRTLIVVHADHGEEFFEHGGFGHGNSFYQEIIRVPLIISGPYVQPGTVIQTPVPLLDLMPTLIDIAGGTIPPEARGRSIKSALQGQEPAAISIYSEMLLTTYFDQKAVLHDHQKLIYGLLDQELALYDLHNDPKELVNIASSSVTATNDRLTLLRDWIEQTAASAEQLPRLLGGQGLDQDRIEEQLRQGGY